MHPKPLVSVFSPVELVEHVKIGSSIYEVQKGSNPSITKALSDEDKIRHSRFVTFPYTKEMEKQDPDHLQGNNKKVTTAGITAAITTPINQPASQPINKLKVFLTYLMGAGLISAVP